MLQVKLKEAVDNSIYFVEGIGQAKPGMPLKLQTRLSTKYIPSQQQQQNQEGPAQEQLSFDKQLVGVVSNGYIEFKSFIFSDGSRCDFKTITKDSEF